MKKIFVIGAPRSGTTYLARALGLADDVAYFEESGAFAYYGARRFVKEYYEVLGSLDAFAYSPAVSRILSFTDRLRGRDPLEYIVRKMLLNTKIKPYDLKPSKPLIEIQQCKLDSNDLQLEPELLKKYRKLAGEGVNLFYQEFFSDFARMSEKNNFLEKTPGHVLFSPVLRSVFPDAKVVLIRRDKKDSVASYIRNYAPRRVSITNRYMTDKMLIKKQCRACLHYKRIEEWLEKQDWCRSIAYKEMIENPFEVTRYILDWVGLTINKDKYQKHFKARVASSKWDRLNKEEKKLVERTLS